MSDKGLPEDAPRHYDRSRRLEHASDEVRWLSSLDPTKRPGLFGSLVATRGLRFAFFAILIAALSAGITWMAMGDDSTGRLAGSSWKLEALRYGEDVLVVLRRSGEAGDAADRLVSMAFSYAGSPPGSLVEGFVGSGASQEFRTALRGGAGARSVRVELRIDQEGLLLEAPIR